ncbi:hypothetical protein DRQ33_07620, partial [bacterium]
MKKILILNVIVLSILFSQTWELKYNYPLHRTYGTDITITEHNKYACVGYIKDTLGWENYLLLQVNDSGEVEWERTYDGSDVYSLNECYSIYLTENNGFIIAATNGFPVLIRTDSLGNIIWFREYDVTSGPMASGVYDVIQTSDGNFVAVGTKIMDGMFIVKADTNGNPLWTGYYGFTPSDDALAVIEDYDGSYLVVGRTEGTFIETYLGKISADGEILFQRIYGEYFSMGTSIIRVKVGENNEYLIAGTMYETDDCGAPGDIFLTKLNNEYNIIWERTYSYTTESDDFGMSVQQTNDGGFIIVGSTHPDTMSSSKLYLIKTDEFGNLQWHRVYGDSAISRGVSVKRTSDNGYIAIGRIRETPEDTTRLYLVKTDSLGEIDWVREIPNRHDDISLSVFPNPFNSSVAITVSGGRGLASQTPT